MVLLTPTNWEQICYKLKNKNETSPERVKNMINLDPSKKIMESAANLLVNSPPRRLIDPANPKRGSELNKERNTVEI
jgi:hypothetical protein